MSDFINTVPSIYLADYMQDYENFVRSYDVDMVSFRQGDVLTQYGVVNNHAYFLRQGILHFLLGHEKGVKALNFFGPGAIFPLGVRTHDYLMEYDMILEAATDLHAYRIPYSVLGRMVTENGDFGRDLMAENCDFVGYMLLDTINHTFEPVLTRTCDVLYLYIMKIQPDKQDIALSQQELANLVGTSTSQMDRCIKTLRRMGIIETSRKHLYVLDTKELLAHCTLQMQGY